ncbi:hypothetical protein ACTXT7_001193 [Hymenolepis weldensis]
MLEKGSVMTLLVYRSHITRTDGISQATHVARFINKRQSCLGMCKHTAEPPVDTIVEILSPIISNRQLMIDISWLQQEDV